MTRSEIFEGLKETLTMVKPKLDLGKVSEDSSLVTDLGIDSLSMLLMSLGIEKRFNFRFDDKVRMETVGQVIDAIETSLK